MKKISALVLYLLLALVGAISYSVDEGGTQYITYNGITTGFLAKTKSSKKNDKGVCLKSNNRYYFGEMANSTLRVGVNPQWDSNPFYFGFHHDGNDYRYSESNSKIKPRSRDRDVPKSKRQECLAIGSYCTYDAIYNLDFESTYYPCYQDGKFCESIVFDKWTHKETKMVDLDKADVSRVSDEFISKDDKSTFYAVEGDEKTWASDGTVKWNNFDLQLPGNYSESEHDCFDSVRVYWNDTTPFTYAFNFTNTTATGHFTISAPVGDITLSFHGKRKDGNDAELNPSDFYGQYSAIGLKDPRENEMPAFEFANGTDVKWKKLRNDEWTARSMAARLGMSMGSVCGLVLIFSVTGIILGVV